MRARLLKPEFWTDEDLVELPFEFRLLFAGLWNMADRQGRLEDRPRRIKLLIFPVDNVDVEQGLTALAAHNKIIRYSHNGQELVWIPGFARNQNCHVREPDSRLAPYEEGKSTVRTPCEPGASPADTVTVTEAVTVVPPSEVVPPSPEDLAAAWNEVAPSGGLALVVRLSADRRRKAKARLGERPLWEWQGIFSTIASTPFLCGQNDRGWRADFDWIIHNETNALKVIEGKYQRGARASPQRRPTNVAAGDEVLRLMEQFDGQADGSEDHPAPCRALPRVAGDS